MSGPSEQMAKEVMAMNVEYSLAPFCNWFLPSCLDMWSSGDGHRVLCSYGARSMVCLFSLTDSKAIRSHDCLNVFNTNKSIISCNKFNRNARKPYLFIGSNEGEAALLDCDTNQLIYSKIELNDLNLPSKKILSADWSHVNDNSVVYYCIHSVIISWNTTTQTTNRLMIGDNYHNTIAISCIVSTSCGQQKLAIGYMNGDIIIVYLNGGMSSQLIEETLSGHNDDICSLSFGWSKGQYEEGILGSISRDGFVKVWDVFNKNNIADIKLDANKAKNKNWFSLAVIPNSGSNKFEILIGSGGGDLLCIEIPHKPPDSKIRVHKPMSFYKNKSSCHSSVVFSIAVDMKTMLALTSSLDHQILVWDLKERRTVSCLNTFSYGVHDISVSPIDPMRVAIGIGEGFHVIKFDDQLNAVNQRRFSPPFKSKDTKTLAIVWHPEYENRLAYGTSNGDIMVLDVNSNQKSPRYVTKKPLKDMTKIYCLVWGPSLEGSDESTLYCVHQSGKMYLHYISSNRIIEFTDYVNEEIKRTELMWKTNYKHLSIGNDNGSVDIFELENNKLELKLRIYSFKRAILCIQWNSNKDEETSNWLAISSYDNNIHCYSLHNYFNCVDIETDKNSVPNVSKPNYLLKGHSDRISSMSWCPFDANKLVSVSYDKSALIWDVLRETPLMRFNGHRGILYSVVWSAFDEDLIYSGGEDNYFHAWRPSKQVTDFNQRLSPKGDNEWPHLEVQEAVKESNGSNEKCVETVLKECVNRVVYEANGVNGGKGGHKPKKKKVNKELKKCSIFPLSNCIENSSTKFQKLEDIEALFNKTQGNGISDENGERILLYGSCDDIKEFVRSEASNHVNHGNDEQRDIVNLFFDIKSAIEESIERKETNPYLVSLSIYSSRNHWKESCELMAKHLLDSEFEMQSYKMYSIEMSAILLVSQNHVREAIDLLLSNHLFREALIVTKTRYESEEVVRHVMTQWAKYRKNSVDFEGAAKCLTAVGMFSEAADLLETRNDQQFNHTISLLKSVNK